MGKAVTLRMLDRADREVMKLPRADIGAVYEFMHKFRRNPQNPGLRFKQLSGDTRLWSARVNQDYRALLLHIADQDYLLVAIRHRSEVYDNLDRYAYRINRVTGGIEVIDLAPVGDSIVGRVVPPAAPAAVSPESSVPPAEPVTASPTSPTPLFAAFTDAQLVELGVAEPLLPQIRELASETALLELADRAPQLTADVLLSLYDGRSYDEVLAHVTEPVREKKPVDLDDYRAAVSRPATQVSSDDEALRAMLAESFDRWQIFLHPAQRALVEKSYQGPARVGGGPGTGKTIVALHRVAHLVRKLPPGTDKPILLTTFNRNLAADLRTRLIALGGQELVARVDIVNIDRLASRVVAEAKAGAGKRIVDDNRVPELWQAFLLEIDEKEWDAEFLAAEWTQVILGQVLSSRSDYFRARRPGRGRALSRAQRDRVWQLTERFTKWLDDQGKWTWRQVAERAARLEMDRAARNEGLPPEDSGGFLRHRYRHIVVDEAQDLSAAHWKMLRAMVAPGPDDLFLVGDTHQRIYDNHVTLGSLGIHIRGRSARLTLSYRTTRQILAAALEIMSGETYDDLDGGAEDLAGYRSLLSGERPTFRGASSSRDERELIVEQVAAWGNPTDGSVAIALPSREMVGEVVARLDAAGIPAVQIGPDGPSRTDGVHVGTMHRFKGLEYQRIIIAGVSDGLVPAHSIDRYRHTDPRRYQRERQRYRSLLFVAATRARDSLAVFWSGRPSPFLTERLVNPVADR